VEIVGNVHPDQLPTISRDPRPLPHNLARPNQILQHLLVNRGEGARSGTLLLVGAGSVAFGFREDAALGEEDNVFVGELFFELAGEPKDASAANGRKEAAG